MPSADKPPRTSRDPLAGWAGLFQQSAEAVFLLNRQRRIRFVNKAWEQLTGQPLETVLGLFCLPRKRKGVPPLQSLAQTLAPPAEVRAGRSETVRRPIPGARVGPPWWDITFFPLMGANGLLGVLGKIVRVGEGKPTASGGRGFTEPLMRIRQRPIQRFTFDLLASTNPHMDRLAAQARAASETTNPVWVVGEAGSGKETLARVIHFQGKTREKIFLKIDCAGLQPFLVRSMLFGQNGLADSGKLGTLFLKEPSTLTRDVQSLLLDWYLEHESPPRFVLASNDAPETHLRSEKLLSDFWSVLSVQELRVPPLRERKADLPRLLARIGERVVAPFPGVSPEAMQLFEGYDWPGNLRELHQILLEAVKNADGKKIEPAHLPPIVRERIRVAKGLPPRPNSSPPPLLLEPILKQTERKLIQLALQRARGNKTEAADILGLARTQLWRKLKDHGLEAD
jgi:transcriptional regulator with PAS, ATPase and Fis domain